MTIYTIGYGNDKPVGFADRLQRNKIDCIVDVRRSGSKARLYCYNPTPIDQPEIGMAKFLKSHGISYLWCDGLGNTVGLAKYKTWLEEFNPGLSILKFCMFRFERVAILCCEKYAYKPNRSGTSNKPNCHRVYVAEYLASKLGLDCDIVHL